MRICIKAMCAFRTRVGVFFSTSILRDVYFGRAPLTNLCQAWRPDGIFLSALPLKPLNP